jgi:hypothetical protein
VLPVTDKAVLLRLLGREEEVAQARQPGQGRREAFQCMREAADAFGSPQHSRSHGTDPSVFGASEHDKNAALARHRTRLQELRTQHENQPTLQNATEDAASLPTREVGVESIQDEGEQHEVLGPVAFAKRLCDEAGLTAEQRGPVALVARDMQRVYEEEMRRRAGLTDAQREALACGAAEHAVLPLKGRRLRLLLYGGGGCGKTKIINLALAPLFRRFYGDNGLVLTAFANKPA